jgi:hypothetical protein
MQLYSEYTMPKECFICLEETYETKPSLEKCSCDFVCHTRCWQNYIATKGHYECPICHKVSRLLPSSAASIHTYIPPTLQPRSGPTTQTASQIDIIVINDTSGAQSWLQRRTNTNPMLGRTLVIALLALILSILIIIIWHIPF